MQALELQNMESTEHLAKFIREAVCKPKRERYAGYLANKKGKLKFLAALDHDLEKDIKLSKSVKELSENDWSRSGVFYSSRGAYAIHSETIKQAYENAPWEGGWLILSKTGKYGIYRPEGRMDDELYIKL